jgi:hypothetical protein
VPWDGNVYKEETWNGLHHRLKRAIEHGNTRNPLFNDCKGSAMQAALHAFDATTLAKLTTAEAYRQEQLVA